MRLVLLITLLCLSAVEATAQTESPSLPQKFPLPVNPIELARAARPHTYFEAVGRKAAIFGYESGEFESWVFPIKLFHDARLSISVEGQDNPVDFASNVERIITRPEATTLVAANQLFIIRATFFTPIDQAGSIILLDIDTARPMTISVSFVPDLKPMWPGGLGGQSARWREELKAFVISESRRQVNALFGSPAATRAVATPAHQLASGALRFELKVDPHRARRSYYPLIIAGGTRGREPVVELYQRLSSSIAEQYQKTFDHYRRLREEMMSIETPDRVLNLAFEWAKVSLDKGMVDNPDLGYGLVAGWGATGDGARPGFGWFFGGDAAVNSYAMTGYGDFEAAGTALRFLAKYQRADGKIPHEISQSAGMIRWFEEYPYAFIHAETTPFYIAAVYNLYRQSGDRGLIEELRETLKKAYQFCVANDGDGDGILENSKAGLGASELGSLLADLHQDIYLAAINIEASLAMSKLAAVMGDEKLREEAEARYQRALAALNKRYWNQVEGRYAYALTKSGQQNMEITAWTAVPLMFRQLDEKLARGTLATLASAQLSTDWGTRMLSNASKAYDPIAYNNGGVWPFLTGFVACGQYEYQRPHSAFAHLRQIAQLTFDHALGYHPEILSGDYYRPLDESVPHQLFSSGMVITPFIRGLLGLRAEASERRLRLVPQLPAVWDRMQVRNYRVGTSLLSLRVERASFSTLRFEITKNDDQVLTVEMAPALPALAQVRRVTADSKPLKFSVTPAGPATLCAFETELRQRTVIEINFAGGFELEVPQPPVQLGERTSSLKVIETTASAGGQLTIELEGRAGQRYILRARGGLNIQSIEGGTLKGEESGWKLIEVEFPAADEEESYQSHLLIFKLK